MSLHLNLARRTKSALMVGTATIALVAAIAVPNFARAHTTVQPTANYLMENGLDINTHAFANSKTQFYRLVSQSRNTEAKALK